MTRKAGRRHRYLTDLPEGQWVWLEQGFPPLLTKTGHRGTPGLHPALAVAGLLRPPVVESTSQHARPTLTPAAQRLVTLPGSTLSEEGQVASSAKRSYSVAVAHS